MSTKSPLRTFARRSFARRSFQWKKARTWRERLAVVIGTACGAGFSPVAPGTVGTLVGIPLAYATSSWEVLPRVAFWLTLTVLGSWACQVFDETMGTQDNQNLVIDEVVGVAITGWTAGADLKAWVAAFILFRIFDVIKPPPVRQVDRWSHKESAHGWKGFGVMADDLVAGTLGLVMMLALQWLGII